MTVITWGCFFSRERAVKPYLGILGTSGSVISGQKIQRELLYPDLGIFKKSYFGNWASVIFCPGMTLTQFSKEISLKIMTIYGKKIVWISCPEMTPAHFPKSYLWNFCWIFCPEMTLAQFPEFGFLSRIHG